MAAVGQLISGVAHELNNPLTAILGYSQLLTSSGQMGPQGIEYADKLYKQAQRTHRIVQNLLSFARQHKPERVPRAVNRFWKIRLALRDYDLRMSNIRVHLELAPDLPLTSADPHQLQQVFLNMVNNAVDAILEHSKDGDLWVRHGSQRQTVVHRIHRQRSRAFRKPRASSIPFYTTKPVGKGTGLGLSICYGIITEHGGTIRVRNLPPRGASFTIEVPHQPAKPAKSFDSLQPVEQARECRILLVDQDDSVLEAVSAILLEREHAVETAKSAAEAMALLEKKDFDLVLADLDLSGTATRNILHDWIAARRPGLAKRCVWMRGAAPLGSPQDEATHNGYKILQKPFEAGELLAAVDETLTRIQTAPVQI